MTFKVGYPYLTQLLALEQANTQQETVLPDSLAKVTTPLQAEVWSQYLGSHPDKTFVNFLLRGIKYGSRIGFNPTLSELKANNRNMFSAEQHPEVVNAYIQGEVESNRMLLVGKEDLPEAKQIHCSPFGVIPKKNKPGHWRLILDLSSPEGNSVNDGIAKELASLSYVSVDDMIAVIAKLGEGAILAKLDMKQAYRHVPVSPLDRHYLGMQWGGNIYIDAALPFGLRSAPLLFTAIADTVQWVAQQEGVKHVLHYIDDFVTIGRPGSPECANNLATITTVCNAMSLPIENKKTEGSATCITFLGIEIDSVAMEIRLPADKLALLKENLARWQGKKSVRKRNLLSLIGSLSHACKVVRSGRAFLRRLLAMSSDVEELDHFVRLNSCAMAEVEWWYVFGSSWNGVSMLLSVNKVNPTFSITTDASGSWGCGGFSGSQWFCLPWNSIGASLHITVQELIPITLAAALWGRNWSGHSVQVWCDNEAAVNIINQNSSKDLDASHLLRCLAFIRENITSFCLQLILLEK